MARPLDCYYVEDVAAILDSIAMMGGDLRTIDAIRVAFGLIDPEPQQVTVEGEVTCLTG